MFIRPRGRQVLLLQSYRDSQGRVRQRCLARFRDRESIEQQWSQVTRQLGSDAQLRRLRAQALEAVDQIPQPRQSREEKISRQTRALARLLSQNEPPACALETLTRQACELAQQQRWAESQEFLARLPGSDPWSQMNRAALLLSQGETRAALSCINRALARQPELLPSIRRGVPDWQGDYWEKHGHLWDEPARAWLVKLSRQVIIKVHSARVREGAKRRTLVRDHSLDWLTERLTSDEPAPPPGNHPHSDQA